MSATASFHAVAHGVTESRLDEGDFALASQVRCSSFSLGSFGQINVTGADGDYEHAEDAADDRVGQLWLRKSAEIDAQEPTEPSSPLWEA